MCEAALRVAAISILAGLLWAPQGVVGQTVVSPVEPGEEAANAVQVVAFSVKNQPAGDAVEIVRSLLSAQGRVEVQGDSNTLIIRDTKEYVTKAREWLERFDHPKVRIEFTLRLVEASMGEKPSDAKLPIGLIRRLSQMLRFDRFDQKGMAEIRGLEGQQVSYRVDANHRIAFRVGTVLDMRRLKLHDFQVFRAGEQGQAESLIHTHLVLRLGQTLVLGLARSEESEKALMVVVDSKRDVIQNTVVSPVLGDNPKSR